MNYVKLGWTVRHILEVAFIIWIAFKASVPVTIFCALVTLRFWAEDWKTAKRNENRKKAAEELLAQLGGLHGPVN